ncbi:hypothetical protein [Pseudemcibacter aquimaris]|uniref:hypothetical protein n=1 Tax=Pseudemcibacter aquimaris TaxID=2857064 RepID=UPI00201353E1|nr:hypothetical protein [Pseudemcibacter aquimaris]MCC3859889.1 hypothetical protein [Pseudemcibacter aquimaris]WDU57221.1 hypothetical protein KW060_08425 [Pseudemcibacter aquimaris]
METITCDVGITYVADSAISDSFDVSELDQMKSKIQTNSTRELLETWITLYHEKNIPLRKDFTLNLVKKYIKDLAFGECELDTGRFIVLNHGEGITSLHNQNFLRTYIDEMPHSQDVKDFWTRNFRRCVKGHPYLEHFRVDIKGRWKVAAESIVLPIKSGKSDDIDMFVTTFVEF